MAKKHNSNSTVDTSWGAVFRNRFTRRALIAAIVMSTSAIAVKSGDIVAIAQGMLP